MDSVLLVFNDNVFEAFGTFDQKKDFKFLQMISNANWFEIV